MVGGQLMDLIPAPNRCGQPMVYSLCAWAWRRNPKGNFAQWNPNVHRAEAIGGALSRSFVAY
jgi:hypothetical protein